MIVGLTKNFFLSHEKAKYRSSIILIATAGIFFATTAVMVALGVLSGYQKIYRNAVLNFSAHIIVFKDDGLSQKDQKDLEQFLSTNPIAKKYSPYHFYEALAPGKQGFRPIIFKGVDPLKMKAVYPVEFEDINLTETNFVYAGKDFTLSQPQILSGSGLKYLILKSEDGQTKTRYKQIAVKGTFESGYYDFDSRYVLMPLSLLQSLFFNAPTVSGFEIRLDNLDQLPLLQESLYKQFNNEFQIITWEELNQSLFQALKLDRTVVFSVIFLILVIACLNVFGFNFLFFVERKREFLILSALGMGLRRMRKMLMFLSLCLGGVSACLGAGMGLVILKLLSLGKGIPIDPEVYFVDRIPVSFNLSWFVMAVIGTTVLCLLTSFLAGKAVLKRYMTSNLS